MTTHIHPAITGSVKSLQKTGETQPAPTVTTPLKIVVVMEGGICQGVSSNDPQLIGAEYTVIDYDVEGADAADCSDVQQSDGTISEAIIGGGKIDKLAVTIAE